MHAVLAIGTLNSLLRPQWLIRARQQLKAIISKSTPITVDPFADQIAGAGLVRSNILSAIAVSHAVPDRTSEAMEGTNTSWRKWETGCLDGASLNQ